MQSSEEKISDIRMPETRHIEWHLRRRSWIAVDFCLSAAAVLVSYALQPGFILGWATATPTQPGAYQATLIYACFVLLCMHVAGMHDPLADRRRWFAILRIGLAVISALVMCLLVLYLVSLQQIGRTILIRIFILSTGLLIAVRLSLWQLASSAPRRVGCYMSVDGLARFRKLIDCNHIPLDIIGVDVDLDVNIADGVAEIFLQNKVEEVVVSARDDRRAVWLACLNRGVQVTEVAAFVEREYFRVSCNDIDMVWFLNVDLKWNHPFYHRIKRILDLFASVVGLLISTPVIVVAALATLVEGGRPVFYSQMRVGFQGKPYRLWKLRTMRIDAERAGPQWAKESDYRVTGVGRILRRTRIDELPQFWNVIKGEMSLIGPRPERPEFVEQLCVAIPMFQQRHWIKPGITGWAQINYPYAASVEDAYEKLCYDLYYLKNASLLLDLHIILRTIGTVMKGSR